MSNVIDISSRQKLQKTSSKLISFLSLFKSKKQSKVKVRIVGTLCEEYPDRLFYRIETKTNDGIWYAHPRMFSPLSHAEKMAEHLAYNVTYEVEGKSDE